MAEQSRAEQGGHAGAPDMLSPRPPLAEIVAPSCDAASGWRSRAAPAAAACADKAAAQPLQPPPEEDSCESVSNLGEKFAPS